MIRKTGREDIRGMADLYCSCMEDSFLAKLGKKFIRELLAGIIRSEHSVSYVLAIDGNIAGFIIGATSTPLLIKGVLGDKWRKLLWSVLPAVLKKPVFWKNIIHSFIYSDKTEIKGVSAELLFIAVEAAYRRNDFGKELINKALEDIKGRGIDKVKVSTLSSNKIVNALLAAYGVKLERVFKFYGKDMNLYTFK